jgi:tetratricopeptide (TPR) repeat protein
MKFRLLILLLLPLFCFSQQEAKHDSIMEVIEDTPLDSVKAKNYLNLGDMYAIAHQDSALKFYGNALRLAKESGYPGIEAKCYNRIGIIYLYQSEFDTTVYYFKKSLDLKKKIGDQAGMANSYNNLGIIAKNRGNYAKAIDYYNKVLEIRKNLCSSISNEELHKECLIKIGDALMNIGNVHYSLGDYPDAIAKYKQSLAYYDSVSHRKGISSCYNNIGNIFEEQENFDKAIEYYNQSLEINLKLEHLRNIGTLYNNIGEVYLKQSELTKALKYFNKSLTYREETNDKRGISAVYSNLAMVYYEEGKYSDALEILNKALKIDYQIGDKKGTAEDLNYLAQVNLAQGRYSEAVDMARKSLEISTSIQAPLQSKESHRLLSMAYEKQGSYKKALEEHKVFKEFEDRLFNKEKHEQIEELEQQYQAEKKQQMLEKQQVLLDKQKAEIKQQKTIRYFYTAGSIFLLVVSSLIYWNFRQKQKANKRLNEKNFEIEAQNEELHQQNEEILNQRNELQKQRDLANSQKDAIAVKNEEITSSIQYAKSIQSAVLPQDHYVSKILKNYFILFKPKDIVSGDFYWCSQKNNKIIAAAVDCTGHGVPGAFMSLLGMSLLNDIVDEMKNIQANEILNILRTRMIQSLHQTEINEENRDGMDIALIVWDKKTNEVQYSGAYNSLYLVRDKKLIEYKPNRMTISIRSRLDKSFTNNLLEAQPGDMIYLSTDGYSDQINDQTNKKMTRRRFKDFLVKIADKELSVQKEELNKNFESWRGDYEQVDDVLVVGIRIPGE